MTGPGRGKEPPLSLSLRSELAFWSLRNKDSVGLPRQCRRARRAARWLWPVDRQGGVGATVVDVLGERRILITTSTALIASARRHERYVSESARLHTFTYCDELILVSHDPEERRPGSLERHDRHLPARMRNHRSRFVGASVGVMPWP